MTNETNELIVLGAALDAPGLWLAHASRVQPDLFVKYRVIAGAICELTADGKPTEAQSVVTALAAKGINQSLADLLAMGYYAPISAHSLGAAVDALHDAYKRQQIRKLGNQMAAEANKENSQADYILANAIATLTEIGARSITDIQRISEILPDAVKRLNRPPTTGCKTGIANIDAIIGGFRPGQLIVLGARPSMGKTALALGIVRAAAQAGKTAVVISLEMTRQEVCHRILADLSKVMLTRFTTHQLASKDFEAITNAANTAHRFKIFIGERADQIGSACRQIKHKHGLDLVVVDYLQLLEAKGQSREHEIAKLSRSFKLLAGQLGCPVLLLSQLNRQVEQRSNKRPQLSDLRESGAIEQDADIAMLLWRPGYYDPEADQAEAELVLAKQRNGPTGVIPLVWDQTTATFSGRKTP